MDYAEIPRDIVDMHKYVTLVADVMFVNGLPFLVSSSRGISSNYRISTVTNCEVLRNYFRASAKGLCKRRVCCPNNDEGHGVREVS